MSGHVWVTRDDIAYVYCNRCSVIRRPDGKNTPCKGVVRVELRKGEKKYD